MLSLQPAGGRTACIVIMDVPEDGGVASVMSSCAGESSVYYSGGGAMLGGGRTQDRASSFAVEVRRRKSQMTAVDEYPYPAEGNVRFYLRDSEGLFSIEVPQAELERGKHPLSPAFKLGRRVKMHFDSLRTAIQSIR